MRPAAATTTSTSHLTTTSHLLHLHTRLQGAGFSWFVVFAPLYVLLLPAVAFPLVALIALLRRKYKKTVPSDDGELPAPTWAEAEGHLRSLVNAFLLVAQFVLLSLRLDCTLECSSDDSTGSRWWAVLSPCWALLVLQYVRVARSHAATAAATKDRPPEERAARRVATIAISSLLSLVAVSLLLLCLLLGGTASYSAAVVFVPIFILLALVLCCGCCALCMGMAAAAGAGMEMPPDMEQGGGMGGMGGMGGGGGATSMADGEQPGATLQAGAGGGPRSAPPTKEEMEAMGTRQLKEELKRRDVPHDHCVEKSELLALLLQVSANGTQ